MTKFWVVTRLGGIRALIDGSLQLEPTGNGMGGVQVLPPQNRLGTPSGTCAPDGQQFCSIPWPSQVLGPIPQAPPSSADVYYLPGSPDMTVCGKICSGPQGYGSNNAAVSSFCAIPSSADIRKLGLDPVFPPAVCHVLAAMAVGSVRGRTLVQ